jgi:hypothetical protein
MRDDRTVTVSAAHYADLVRAAAARSADVGACLHAPYDCRSYRDPLYWCIVCKDAAVFPERAIMATVVPFGCPAPHPAVCPLPPVRWNTCPASAPESEPTFRCDAR